MCVFVCVCVLCAMHGGVFYAQLRATLGMMREVCVCVCVCLCLCVFFVLCMVVFFLRSFVQRWA